MSTPRVWRAGAVALNVGIFDPSGNPVDRANLSSLMAVLQPAQLSPYSIWTKTLLASAGQIITLITGAGWENGTQWNAQFLLSAADTDQGLGGEQSQDYWLSIIGMNASDGSPIVYAGGVVTIYNPGGSLPSPAAAAITSRNPQATSTGDFTVTPLSQLHKEIITVSGSARTVNCILGIAGIQDGAELTTVFVLPATPGITINIRSGIVSNPIIAVVDTGTVLQERLKFYFDDDAAAWVPEVFDVPSP